MLQEQNKKKKQKVDTTEPSADSSAFQELFAQRAQGFRIDFGFRNAPPRPPVGPCFVGLGLEGNLQDFSQYRSLNAVEVNYSYRLHTEPDLGVPLAPSAMDDKCYKPPPADAAIKLHPNDEELLNWKGPMGDTAAEELQRRRDQARAAARMALAGKSAQPTTPSNLPTKKKSKKAYSRVLDESLQSFMKKTTYLSNDYTRRVHDFTSLAQTKQKTEQDLQVKQTQINRQRSAGAIEKSFKEFVVRHPTKKNVKPVWDVPLLPNVRQWGHAFTHVVVDNPPKGGGEEEQKDLSSMNRAFVAHVEKKQANARMTCHLMVPSPGMDEDEEKKRFRALQRYDLDVVPLKEEDEPHVNFVVWISDKQASYLPISSRVQLSTGRPSKKVNTMSRQALSMEDKRILEERIAEVDLDVANKMGNAPPVTAGAMEEDDEDEDEGFGTRTTIIADDNQ